MTASTQTAAYAPHPSWSRRAMAGKRGPVLVICVAIVAIWYVGAVFAQSPVPARSRRRAMARRPTSSNSSPRTLSQPKPTLPAPHQVAVEI